MRLLLLLFLLVLDSGDKYLSDNAAYQKSSYFKEKVYAEHNWQSFYKMKEPHEIADPDNYDLHLLNAAVFFSTNKLREKKKLKSLTYSAGLRDAAVVHTRQMIDKKFFSHINSKTPKLRTPDGRILMFDKNFNGYGENIDLSYVKMPSQTTYIQVADMLVDDWYNSPPHKKNMLSKQYTHLGCAAVFETKTKDGVRYVKGTQDFGVY